MSITTAGKREAAEGMIVIYDIYLSSVACDHFVSRMFHSIKCTYKWIKYDKKCLFIYLNPNGKVALLYLRLLCHWWCLITAQDIFLSHYNPYFLSLLLVCTELLCLYSGSWLLHFLIACIPAPSFSLVIVAWISHTSSHVEVVAWDIRLLFVHCICC